VTPSWFSPATIGGLLFGVVFFAVCYTNIRLGIILFTALGAVRGLQIGAFSGSESTQGLLLVEVLATALMVAWFLRLSATGRRFSGRVPFNTPLLLLLPASLLSLIVGFTWFDPTVPVQNMKLAVSTGQILLLVWPIGTYLAVANSVDDDQTIRAIRGTIIVLALPSLGLLVAPPSMARYLEWSMTFALPASSLCFAEFFYTRSMPRRLALLVLTFAPVLVGYASGKAFYYAYVVASSAVIVALKSPYLFLRLAPVALAGYIVLVPLVSGSFLPGFLERAIETEEAQQSLGGTGGREQLIADGLSIWSRHPVFGVGPGNNYPYMLRYSSLGTAHNQYVNLLMELGLIGFACFMAFAFHAARMGFKVWRNATNPLHEYVTLAWLGVFGAMLVGGMFGDFMLPSIRNSGLELFSVYYLQWILLGVMVSISALQRGQRAALAA
jgi:O-antigen ligase